MSRSEITQESIHAYLTVGEAASMLGVSKSTLRNWDRVGKLKAFRHPVNGYRLYRREELEALLKKVRASRDGESQ